MRKAGFSPPMIYFGLLPYRFSGKCWNSNSSPFMLRPRTGPCLYCLGTPVLALVLSHRTRTERCFVETLPPSQGDGRPSCMHSMMSLSPCLILGRQHRKHMGPWPSRFKDCEYSTREASPKGGWGNIEELSHTLGTRLWHKRDTGIAQVFTKITLARRHSFT